MALVHDSDKIFIDNLRQKQEKVDKFFDATFDFYISTDPSTLLNSPIVYKTGRPLLKYENKYSEPSIPTFGCATLAIKNKGIEDILLQIQREYDEAIIRINMPKATFVGESSTQDVKEFEKFIVKPNIKLEVTQNWFTTNELLDFLAQNTANIYLYNDKNVPGVSSSTDYALSVNRPVIVSNKSNMFRHLLTYNPEICIENNSIKNIVAMGLKPIQKYIDGWQSENLCWDYERILDDVLKRTTQKNYKEKYDWAGTYIEREIEDSMLLKENSAYENIILPDNFSFNTVLEDNARVVYKNAIDKLFELFPETMKKKILDANIQQAFVLDSVIRFAKEFDKPKMLCIGSFQDTAYLSLLKMGYDVYGIDPMLNYDLETFITKPNVNKAYDIIFSTSVIEHVEDDETFVQQAWNLLSDKGIFILTCDYKNGWKNGDNKPDCDYRLYNNDDLTNRLVKFMPNYKALGDFKYEGFEPEFKLDEKNIYNFASLVVKKVEQDEN